MCRSQRDGGQRCYSGARQALDRVVVEFEAASDAAQAARESGVPEDIERTSLAEYDAGGRVIEAQRVVASTPQGQADLQTRIAAASDDRTRRSLGLLAQQGQDLRDRNERLRKIGPANVAVPSAISV